MNRVAPGPGSPNATARALVAHALGVSLDEACPSRPVRPCTWKRWHEDEREARAVQIGDAYRCIANLQKEKRELWYSRNHWRLASAVGWAAVALLLAAGWGR